MKNILLAIAVSICFLSNAQTFTLKSNELGGQATKKQAYNSFGCTGENISPQLYWENPPIGTKSFAVSIYDENAPTGSGWWHWLIFDLDKEVRELKSGAGDIKKQGAPLNSIQSKNDLGLYGYQGPCPGEGEPYHKYTVTVNALKVAKLGLDSNATPAITGYYLQQNLIEKASLVFYMKR